MIRFINVIFIVCRKPFVGKLNILEKVNENFTVKMDALRGKSTNFAI
jgi:hypothetical protein